MEFQLWAGSWIRCTAFQFWDACLYISTLDLSHDITCGHIHHHWKLMVKDVFSSWSNLVPCHPQPQTPGSEICHYLEHSSSCNLPMPPTTLPSPAWLWNTSQICLLFPNMSFSRLKSHPHMFTSLHVYTRFLSCLSTWPSYSSFVLHTIYNSLSS